MATDLFLGLVELSAFDAEANKPLANLQYSRVLFKSSKRDESDIYCGLNGNGECTYYAAPFPEKFQTSFDLLKELAETYPNNDHLGVREKQVAPNGEVKLGDYKWTSLSFSITTAMIIGSALLSEPGLLVETVLDDDILKRAKFLGIWARNCPYWLLTDYASIAYGIVTVPLYETMGDEALLKIFEETQIQTLCIDASKMQSLLRLREKLPNVKNLVVFDSLSAEEMEQAKNAGMTAVTMDELINRYRNKTLPLPKAKRSDIATVIYTSGTSGIPKGAVHTNLSLMELARRVYSTGNRLHTTSHFTTLSYLPMSHVYERFVEHFAPLNLGRIGYYGGNIKDLMDDIQTLQPDLMVGVPRVFTKILERIRSTIDGKPACLKALINWAVNKKRELLVKSSEIPSHWLYDIILKKIKKSFGGKLQTMVLGSAAMAEKDIIDLQNYLTCPLSEGWGTTEIGVAFVQDFRDKKKGTIGGPMGDVIFKLVSIPEMEYDARANPPRGELLVKGSGFMLGYLQRPKETAEVLDEEGWYHTGDVVELLPNMGLKILDRARNFFKLSQGEYIAPDKLENLYIGCPYVEQIFIHGEASRDYIVGIVVVNKDAVTAWAASRGKANMPMAELLKDSALIGEIQACFTKITEQNKLNGLERLHKFTLIDEPFSVENELLTPTFKTVRKKVRVRYENEIKAMYEQ
ncbi:putative kong chain acyl-CoA synthetase [Babesia sp. Xinjiang]|uniref:putative kong chain acyl-CoA synthetase n=1 Tax=Babesia sp. Xinjiang TaxID=462227 RepID=UPI000A22E407|nr:putative kong chain acyl-CoA synthetase [Babesia sp. Xinjiang]ORM41797.1 putative kong chain acyl-CoA synthetase [Babesia sp. Xinjiang]